MKSVRIVLMPEHREESRERQVYSAVSDSDGRFTIKDVPAGRYQFSARHTGCVDQQYQSHSTENGAVLALQSGQEIKDVIFWMILAAVITGRVNDEDGEPMAVFGWLPSTGRAKARWMRIHGEHIGRNRARQRVHKPMTADNTDYTG